MSIDKINLWIKVIEMQNIYIVCHEKYEKNISLQVAKK